MEHKERILAFSLAAEISPEDMEEIYGGISTRVECKTRTIGPDGGDWGYQSDGD